MAQFTEALNFILGHEGDKLFISPTERSRYGITEKLLKSIKYTITDPNNLQQADILRVYYSVFWCESLQKINSQLLANKIFDMMVNMGNGQAVKLLQASINSIGGACVIDGILGPHTVITVNACDDERLLSELVLKSVSFYRQIAKGEKEKYLAGWLTRAEDIGNGRVDKTAFNTLRDGSSDRIVKG